LGALWRSSAVAVFWSARLERWRTFTTDDTLRGVMIDTAKTTSLVFIILLGAAMLTAAFRAFGGEELVKEFLTRSAGRLLDPVHHRDAGDLRARLLPRLHRDRRGRGADRGADPAGRPSANITAVWLGVMIGLNIQTSFLTPPFGFALFYLRGVAPASVTTVNMYKGVVPFIALQLLALVIVGNVPAMVNYLPTRLSLLGETAPPPRNPRLQACVEEYKFEQYKTNRAEITAAITGARGLDLSYLPDDLQRDFKRGLDRADQVFERVAAVNTTAAAVEAATPGYRPLHVEVRALERDMRRYREHIKDLTTQLQRNRQLTEAERQELRETIDRETAAIKELEAKIPANWDADHKAFVELQKVETDARRQYRRTVDQAYEPVKELRAIVAGADALQALRADIEGLESVIGAEDNEAAGEKIREVSRAVGDVEGTRAITRHLNRARRALRGGSPDPNEAREELAKALAEHDSDFAWRSRAARDLKPGLDAYDGVIRGTIGLRQLDKLPREQALYVAACQSSHRDISLSF
jgi:predicted  nucleic acid-binding Zn-ribbon protein